MVVHSPVSLVFLTSSAWQGREGKLDPTTKGTTTYHQGAIHPPFPVPWPLVEEGHHCGCEEAWAGTGRHAVEGDRQGQTGAAGRARDLSVPLLLVVRLAFSFQLRLFSISLPITLRTGRPSHSPHPLPPPPPPSCLSCLPARLPTPTFPLPTHR